MVTSPSSAPSTSRPGVKCGATVNGPPNAGSALATGNECRRRPDGVVVVSVECQSRACAALETQDPHRRLPPHIDLFHHRPSAIWGTSGAAGAQAFQRHRECSPPIAVDPDDVMGTTADLHVCRRKGWRMVHQCRLTPMLKQPKLPWATTRSEYLTQRRSKYSRQPDAILLHSWIEQENWEFETHRLTDLVVVEHWFEELQCLAPTPSPCRCSGVRRLRGADWSPSRCWLDPPTQRRTPPRRCRL